MKTYEAIVRSSDPGAKAKTVALGLMLASSVLVIVGNASAFMLAFVFGAGLMIESYIVAVYALDWTGLRSLPRMTKLGVIRSMLIVGLSVVIGLDLSPALLIGLMSASVVLLLMNVTLYLVQSGILRYRPNYLRQDFTWEGTTDSGTTARSACSTSSSITTTQNGMSTRKE